MRVEGGEKTEKRRLILVNSSGAGVEVFLRKPPERRCVPRRLRGVDGKRFYSPIKACLLETNWLCVAIYKKKRHDRGLRPARMFCT